MPLAILALIIVASSSSTYSFPGADQGSFLTGTAGVELPLRENFTVRTKFLLPRLVQLFSSSFIPSLIVYLFSAFFRSLHRFIHAMHHSWISA